MTTSNYNFRHRKNEDLQRQLLNYLKAKGPCPVTACRLFLEINHKQMTGILADLVPSGLISKEIAPQKWRPSQNSLELSITPIGLKYLKKLNRLELMVKWER